MNLLSLSTKLPLYFILFGLFAVSWPLLANSEFSAQQPRSLQQSVEAEQPTMNNVKSCFSGPFSSYSSWFKFLQQRKKKFNQERFTATYPQSLYDENKAAIECYDFTYQVDGLSVAGYYLAPKDMHPEQGDKKLPVLVFNRGGNAGFGAVKFGKKLGFLSELAKSGYIVIGSQYRGSSRFLENNGHDEFGGQDVNDVLALMDLIKTIPSADAEHIGMFGWSRGGMQTFLAAKHLPNLKTLVAIAGNSDVEKALAWRPAMNRVYQRRVPDFEKNRTEALRQRSVVHWLDKLPKHAPILLLHGDQDKRVNVAQSVELAELLKKNNHPHQLVVFSGGDHGLYQHRKELVSHLKHWFAKHL
ncbi:alpha/beta hydrolase family protein [Flocculibacter collagenilyticus]|uniref:alpha/beta hydrolase family protein n=1 Tax=Flocculibacter collagenilyticus TaxID=2744479 RepID=UPI0018F6E38E|nr:prolyl oligopeptidase family serine peptidase [Flocculibacter collagenilyticus]